MKKSKFFKTTSQRVTILILIALIILSLSLAVFFFNSVPKDMATHFTAEGYPNGFSDKNVGLFMFPALLGFLTVLFIILPHIDPLKNNLMKFEKQFGSFIILLSAFFIVIQSQLISWNLGIHINPNIIIPVSLGILFFYIGILLKHSKRNFFIGIRTPWTLSSDFVWEKTHNLGSLIFKILGTIFIITIFFNMYTLGIILIPIIISVIILTVYSYILYTKEQKNKNKISKKKVKK